MTDWFEQQDIDARRQDFDEYWSKRERFVVFDEDNLEVIEGTSNDVPGMAAEEAEGTGRLPS